jgi:hypothetical protein
MPELSCLDVARALIGDGKPKGAEICFACPLHKDTQPSLSINRQTNR